MFQLRFLVTRVIADTEQGFTVGLVMRFIREQSLLSAY